MSNGDVERAYEKYIANNKNATVTRQAELRRLLLVLQPTVAMYNDEGKKNKPAEFVIEFLMKSIKALVEFDEDKDSTNAAKIETIEKTMVRIVEKHCPDYEDKAKSRVSAGGGKAYLGSKPDRRGAAAAAAPVESEEL